MSRTIVAEALNLSRAEVYGVFSFYHDYRKHPAGRHVLKVCRAEACQSMGSDHTTARLMQQLGIGYGVIALGAYLSLIILMVLATSSWVWFPFWIGIGLVFTLERVVTVWSGG